MRNEAYEVLKAGEWEKAKAPKGLLTKVKKLFKLVEAIDDATSTTICGILEKKPEARQAFDAALLQQVESRMDKRLDSFDQIMSQADAEGKYGAAAYRDAVEAVEKAQEVLEEVH